MAEEGKSFDLSVLRILRNKLVNNIALLLHALAEQCMLLESEAHLPRIAHAGSPLILERSLKRNARLYGSKSDGSSGGKGGSARRRGKKGGEDKDKRERRERADEGKSERGESELIARQASERGCRCESARGRNKCRLS